MSRSRFRGQRSAVRNQYSVFSIQCSVVGFVALVHVICVVPVFAQQGRIIETRETEATGVPDYFEQVAAPGAIWCTVSERTNLLIIGHAPGMDRHLTIFKLDSAGHVVTTIPPATVTLPLDPVLAQYDNVAVAGVCHPDLPLLYVLQDLPNRHFASQAGLRLPSLTGSIANSVFEHLDRLLVYSFRDGNIEKLQSVRADWLKFGSYGSGGDLAQLVTLGLDATRGRLHMPLLINPMQREKHQSAHGFLALDDAGLLIAKDGEIVLAETINLTGGGLSGIGCAILPLDRVAWGDGYGQVLIWHRPDGQSQTLPLGQSHACVISGHPTMPIVYAIFAKNRLHFVEFVEGHPTLQPRFLEMGNLLSPPVPMAGRNLLAVGRYDNVTLFGLDAEGEITGEFTSIRLKGTKFRAVHYSPRFDRLYVAARLEP